MQNNRIIESWKKLMNTFRSSKEPNFLKWMNTVEGESATKLHEDEVTQIRVEEQSNQLEMGIEERS